jgi:choline kinase
MLMPFTPDRTRAIILAAGRGSRLGDLTKDRPKCLLEFGGRPLIDWQLSALAAHGVTDVVVIVGFGAKRVAHYLGEHWPSVRLLHNPFYDVSDNLASLWLAREEMVGDMIVLNGDTLVSPEIVSRALQGAAAPITVTIDRKPAYDADDMKVQLDGTRLLAIGKTLPPDQAHAESIGMLLFREGGTFLFRQAIEEAMFDPTTIRRWFLSIIDSLALRAEIRTISIEGLDWSEVDFPADIVAADRLVAGWLAATGASLDSLSA